MQVATMGERYQDVYARKCSKYCNIRKYKKIVDGSSPLAVEKDSGSNFERLPALQFAVTLSEAARLLHCPLSPEAILSGLPSDPTLDMGLDIPGLNDTLRKGGLVADKINQSLEEIQSFKGVAIALLALNSGKKACILITENEQGQSEARQVKKDGVTPISWGKLQNAWTGEVLRLGLKAVAKDQSETMGKRWLWQILWKEVPTYKYVWMAALVINIFALTLPLFNLAVYDRVAPNSAINTLWTLAIGVFIILFFDFIMKELRGYLVDTAARRVDVTVSRKIYEHLMGLRMEHRLGTAGSMADILRGFSSVQEFFSSATLVVLIDLPFVILFISMMFVIGGPLGAIPLVAGPLAILIGLLLQGPLSQASKQAVINGQERQGTLVESISNLEMVRAIGAERVMRRRWQDQVNASALSGMKVKMYGQLASHSAMLLQQLASVSLIIGGVYLIAAGELTMGGLIAVNMLGGRAMQPFTQIASLLSRTYHARVAFKQISEFMERPQLRSSEENYLSRKDLGNEIELKDASFSYPAEQPVQTLYPARLSISTGERVAIIGRIGSGKSTLLKLLAGIYGPQDGAALIGGVDTRQIAPAELRSHVGYVGQDVMLFSGSIRDNICLGKPEATDEEILRAARIAGVEQFVSQHPDGYQRVLGERGAGLSSGQRQSVAIAQALLQEPGILLMDEPSSAMDPTTERMLLSQINSYLNTQRCTAVIVTHTPAFLELVDRLIVVDSGRIVMDGPKQVILQRLQQGPSGKQTGNAVDDTDIKRVVS